MKSVALLAICLLPLLVNAQSVKVISSSSTDWSGGVAGHAGTRYAFTIDFQGFDKNELFLDTIWIGDNATPLIMKVNEMVPFNTTRAAGKKSLTYNINAAVDRSFHTQVQEPYDPGHTTKKTVKPPVKYKGVALLAYHYKGRKLYFTIDKIITKLPPINYP